MAWFQVSFFSQCLGRQVPLQVIIPSDIVLPGVARKPYKTLYLLHGYMGNCTDWLLNTPITEIAAQYDIAIVMPSGENGFYADAARSGYRSSEYISHELVDFTRKAFPLSDKREDTIIGGLSMGGCGTIYNSLRHGDVFGHAISLSAPIGHAENAKNMTYEPNFMGVQRGYYEAIFGDVDKIAETDANPRVLASRVVQEKLPIPDLYIACGYNDMLVHENRRYSDYLSSIGIGHYYEEGPGTHEWAFWDPYLRRGLDHCVKEKPPAFKNPFWIERA